MKRLGNSIHQSASSNVNLVELQSVAIYYENIRSIVAKSNAKDRIESTPYRILCFTETWLTERDRDENVFPSNFNIFRRDRRSEQFSRGGGVAIIVDKKYRSRRVGSAEDERCECVCVSVEMKPSPLLIYLAYVPPSADNDVYEAHRKIINETALKYSNHRLIVVGDWNLSKITWSPDESGSFYLPTNILNHRNSVYYKTASDFLSKLFEVPLYQLSNIENAAANVLDLVFVSDPEDFRVCRAPISVTEVNRIDKYHPPLEITLTGEVPSRIADDFIEIKCYKHTNCDRVIRGIESINFAHELSSMDVNSAFEYFLSVFRRLVDDNTPVRRIKSTQHKPKWWTRQLQTLKNRRDKLFKRKPKGVITEEYAAALRDFNELHDALYSQYIAGIERNISTNPAQFWRYAKSNQSAISYPAEMRYQNDTAKTPEDITNLFANHFENSYAPEDDSFDVNDVYNSVSASSRKISLSLFDVENALLKLKPNGSIGADQLHPVILIRCGDALVFPLWLLFEKSLESGDIPRCLKTSRVLPLFKKGDKSNVENYRIIAISSTILKVFEFAMQPKLLQVTNGKLSNSQHGFRPNRSITTNLIHVTTEAHRTIERGRQLDVFYGDFKSAFDKVSHSILVRKLRKFNIDKTTAKWIYNFLNGRTNFVKIGSHCSRLYRSTSGVPAESVLGPLLFLIFINDIVEEVKYSQTLMFADDIKIFTEVTSEKDTETLQSDINRLLKWCESNRLYFNFDKCATMSIHRTNTFIDGITS